MAGALSRVLNPVWSRCMPGRDEVHVIICTQVIYQLIKVMNGDACVSTARKRCAYRTAPGPEGKARAACREDGAMRSELSAFLDEVWKTSSDLDACGGRLSR